MLIHALFAVTGTLVTGPQVQEAPQSGTGDPPPARRQAYPLNCRGGAPLAFDTIAPRSDTGSVVRLAVSFAPNATAAGPEGQGLQPGSCAWVDRPVSGEEPRRIRFGIHHTDSAPARTVGDTGMYWSFLAYNSGSGHFEGEGYRHWHASSPPRPPAAVQPSTTPGRGAWLPFDPGHLPWYVAAWVIVVGMPMLFVTGWWSGWRRLAGLSPDRAGGRGRAFSCGNMVMALANYRGGVRVKPDESHLHFSTWMLYRPGHPPFSVPWSDIKATRDGWPWFPFKGTPVVRLTLAKYPTLRILMPRMVGERIVAESGDRLQLAERPAPPPPAR
jgi:hypothetical protein